MQYSCKFGVLLQKNYKLCIISLYYKKIIMGILYEKW